MLNLVTGGLLGTALVTGGLDESGGLPPASLGLRQAIEYRLLASPAITALVGSRVYFGAVPQTASLATGPALTYSVPDRPYGHTLAGPDGTSQARVKFSAWSMLESQSTAIAQAIRDRFQGFAGNISGCVVTASILEDEHHIPNPPRAGTDQWIYEIDTTYRVNHRA